MAGATFPLCPCAFHFMKAEIYVIKSLKETVLDSSQRAAYLKVLSTFFWEKTANKTMTTTVLRPLHISRHGSPTPTKSKGFIEVTFTLIKQLSVLCLALPLNKAPHTHSRPRRFEC